ncbi:MAG TPA: ATP-dependent zinc metalloprotease FtsH [Ktedonobacterales bacterium]|nr:ATP-dependent zinc metalloprotease FtsH [Ktedonobacterales bacterium]
MKRLIKTKQNHSTPSHRSPRSPEPSGPRRKPPFQVPVRVAALVMVVFVLGLGLLIWIAASSHSGEDYQPVPISQVLTMADKHEITQATIVGDQLQVTAKDGKKYAATKESQQAVTDRLTKDGVQVTVTTTSVGISQWSQIAINVLILLLIVGFLIALVRRSSMNGGQAVPFGRSKAKRFSESHPSVLFADVAGVEEAKQELEEIVLFLKQPEKFVSMGARIPKGVLLVGPPGTGKTLISRAVAGEAGVAFFSVSGSEFVEMFVGVGASRVRDLFTAAKENAPCIIFIDEIDAVGRQRGAMPTTGNDEREQTLNQLLVELDGFDKQTNVIVIAATNRPDVLDPALLRPGRFDRTVTLEKPDINGRRQILQVHAKDKPLGPEIDMNRLARQTAGFSGADLANLMNEAALLAARNDRMTITHPDLEESILRVVAGPERKSRVITESEKAIIAYHEVGHAIVMRSLPGSDPVQKVSAIARGMALGITVSAPAEDRYLMRRSELLAKMAGLMGGRAAEEIIFGDITTGASNDIERVTTIARKMVCEFGMSPLGQIQIKMAEEGGALSPQTAARVDTEVSFLADQAYQTAKDILLERKAKLISISEHLIDVETIDGEELDRLLMEQPSEETDQQIPPLTLDALAQDVIAQ